MITKCMLTQPIIEVAPGRLLQASSELTLRLDAGGVVAATKGREYVIAPGAWLWIERTVDAPAALEGKRNGKR